MIEFGGLDELLRKKNEILKIIAYGTGKRIYKFVDLFKDTELWNNVDYFIDGNCEKWNREMEFYDRKFQILSPEKLYELSSSDIIVVTCADYLEILEDLIKKGISSNIYILSCLMNSIGEDNPMEKEIPDNLKLSKEQLIPKVIHYCWFGNNPIPDQYKIWMESWSKYCPDYEIIRWDESNYDITKNQYMYDAYKNKKWGFVPDYARLDIIYNYGGIYLDTDVELIKNMDDMLYQKGFAGFESKNFVNLGLGFGAVKGLSIIKEMMQIYEELNFINDDGSFNLIASPTYQTEVLSKKGLKKDGEYQIVEDMTIFPEKIFCGKNYRTRLTELKSYTHSIHHYDGSWIDDDQRDKYRRMERLIQISTELGKTEYSQ